MRSGRRKSKDEPGSFGARKPVEGKGRRSRSSEPGNDAPDWLRGGDDTATPPPAAVDFDAPLVEDVAHGAAAGEVVFGAGAGLDQCGNQPLVQGVLTKLQTSLSRSNRSRFG